MVNMNQSDETLKLWIEENIIRGMDAHKITGQSRTAFVSSCNRGIVKPFVTLNLDSESPKPTHLYLKRDLLLYRKHLEKKNISIHT